MKAYITRGEDLKLDPETPREKRILKKWKNAYIFFTGKFGTPIKDGKILMTGDKE